MDPWLHLNLLTHLQDTPYLQLPTASVSTHIYLLVYAINSFSLHNDNIEYETIESGKMLSWHNHWDPA